MARLKPLLYPIVGWNYPLTKGKTISVRVFRFQHPFTTNPSIFWILLRSDAYEFVQHFVFFCHWQSRDIVYQCTCLLSWLTLALHGLFGIQLTVYSALSHLTDYGLYYITRFGISLLTIFHIPCTHFQREQRKVLSAKLYLSVLCSVYFKLEFINNMDHMRILSSFTWISFCTNRFAKQMTKR